MRAIALALWLFLNVRSLGKLGNDHREICGAGRRAGAGWVRHAPVQTNNAGRSAGPCFAAEKLQLFSSDRPPASSKLAAVLYLSSASTTSAGRQSTSAGPGAGQPIRERARYPMRRHVRNASPGRKESTGCDCDAHRRRHGLATRHHRRDGAPWLGIERPRAGDRAARIRGGRPALRQPAQVSRHTARTGETIGAKWSEIDLAQGMKAGREHRVPLSARAMDILRDMGQPDDDCFVFIGGKAHCPLSNMAILSVLRRMNRDYRRSDLFDWRRRIMSEWAKFCGTSKQAAQRKVLTFRKGH